MKVWAVTYTDSGEPWGRAVWEDKLYSEPFRAVIAYNRAFQEFTSLHGEYFLQQMRELPANYAHFKNEAEALMDEFSREYSISEYEVVT